MFLGRIYLEANVVLRQEILDFQQIRQVDTFILLVEKPLDIFFIISDYKSSQSYI